MTAGYLLANAPAARQEALAALFDRSTFRRLEALGIAPGWRCWEVGAGGGSVARWLAARVGSSGRVVATDLDVSQLGDLADARHHDVGCDPAPDGPFDVVHARLVLVHVPARDAALRTMVSALRPGGYLVIEDADPALQPLACPDAYSPAEQLANKIRNGFRALLAARGVDLSYGRKLPRVLREAGLADVAAEVYMPFGQPECARIERLTIETLRDALVAAGHATADEIAAHLARVDELALTTAPMVAAWGRNP